MGKPPTFLSCRCPQSARPRCPLGLPVSRFARTLPPSPSIGASIRRRLSPAPVFPLRPWPQVSSLGPVWRRYRAPIRGPLTPPHGLRPCRVTSPTAPARRRFAPRPRPAPEAAPIFYGPHLPLPPPPANGRCLSRPRGQPRPLAPIPTPPAVIVAPPSFRLSQVGLGPSLERTHVLPPLPRMALRAFWVAGSLAAAWRLGGWGNAPGPAFTAWLDPTWGRPGDPQPLEAQPLLGPLPIYQRLLRGWAWACHDLTRTWARGLGRQGPAKGARSRLPDGSLRLTAPRYQTWALGGPWAPDQGRVGATLGGPGWAGTIKFWGWEPSAGAALGPDYPLFRARAAGAYFSDLMARGGAMPLTPLNPLLPADGLRGRRYRGAKAAPGRP